MQCANCSLEIDLKNPKTFRSRFNPEGRRYFHFPKSTCGGRNALPKVLEVPSDIMDDDILRTPPMGVTSQK